jgi:4-hydroxythreonine-4-phosphate dehydrogenase
MRPRVAVTLGDPRGIGPEIIAAALADPSIADAAEWVLVGPTGTAVAPTVGIGAWSATDDAAAAGAFAGAAIETAVAMAQRGEVEAICTAPIDKYALSLAGYTDPGHTEMLARLTRSATAMMLASDRLRVVLATTHIALRAVPDALTPAAILEAVRLTREGLQRWFGITEPRIALCALNPHLGDGGRFGDEDIRILGPAARDAAIHGPFSADTVFVRALRGEFDAVIAPYHDVGMTATKVASFGEAVNVTLGLPFPRTSPDHGTAIDIAGRGLADPSSMQRALRMAAALVGR